MLTVGHTRLRACLEADLEVLTTIRNDVELQANLLALPRGSSRDAVRAWVSRRASDETCLFFIVSDVHTDRALGFVQLLRIDLVHGHAELGIALATDARGHGHGAAAIGLIERYAQDVFRIRKFVLQVRASNLAAVRLYSKLGYERAGTLRAHFYHRGAFDDVTLMERLLSERPAPTSP